MEHDLVCSGLVRVTWIEVSGGTFLMGAEATDREAPRDDEQPLHEVTVSPFRLARAVVTRDEYQAFLDATGHSAPPFWHEKRFAHPRMPAVGPSWHDAMEFCSWIGRQLGETVGLPTEAEWELAAKARRQVLYPWGDEPPEALPDYPRRWQDGPEPVDAYPSRHPWGFVGLGENVHEWCVDWYQPDYYEVAPSRDPRGPDKGTRKASRGGAWRHRIKVSRCTARSSIPPHLRYSDYGFRLRADPS